jgi:hypothetical protein
VCVIGESGKRSQESFRVTFQVPISLQERPAEVIENQHTVKRKMDEPKGHPFDPALTILALRAMIGDNWGGVLPSKV